MNQATGQITSQATSGQDAPEAQPLGADDPFAVGAGVRVRLAWPPGHVRTPAYVRGRVGTVAAILGAHPNPEEVAFRRSGRPGSVLYRVRFRQEALWPDYPGLPADTLDVEIYHHWLEAAETAR